MNKIFIAVSVLILSASYTHSQGWSQLNTTNPPSARTLASSLYDSRNNTLILFGGKLNSGTVLNDVWSLNLADNVWTNITPISGLMPAERCTHNAMYDSLLNRMIIWSGQGTENYNDVWAFNFSNNSWQRLWIDGNVTGVPDKRYGTAAVFDPVTRRMLTFAGFNSSQRYSDTWYFQVDSMIWRNVTNSVHPSGRCLHDAAFDPDQRKMIVYGGFSDSSLHDDIWSLNPETFVWTDLTPAIRPSGRYFVSEIVTDNRNVLIFGGKNAQGTTNQMWKYSLITNSWDSVTQGSVIPMDRYGQSTIYIPSQEKMIIFGGGDDHNFLGDMWVFSNIGVIGIKNLDNEIPKTFMLAQNYPNPFNPSTKINFNIPLLRGVAESRGVSVQLKIFDILGKEITTLVNQQLQPGSYETEWNAANYPSGVYFYRLAAGDFTDTKKMVLIK